jgi:hypothetical protein
MLVVHLDLRRKFLKKIRNSTNGILWAWGKLTHETRSRNSRDTVPSKAELMILKHKGIFLKDTWQLPHLLSLRSTESENAVFEPVFRIRIRIQIHRIHMFLGLMGPDPEPLVRGMDPDPSIIKQK